MSAALPVPLARSAEEWDFLQPNFLKPSRSSKVCITCQHFRYEVDRHCVTLLACPLHQDLIHQDSKSLVNRIHYLLANLSVLL